MHLQIKHNSKRKSKATNSKINPLHILQRLWIISSLKEEDIRSQDWSNDRSNSIEGLGEINAHLSITRRAAHFHTIDQPLLELPRKLETKKPTCNIRIRSSFQRTESIPNNKNSTTKPAKRPLKNARPRYQCTNPIKTQAPYKNSFISIMSKNPIRMSERSEGISTIERSILFSPPSRS